MLTKRLRLKTLTIPSATKICIKGHSYVAAGNKKLA